jgi:hypothetical protein
MGDENRNSRTPIFVALIAVTGVLGSALIANWEKLFASRKHDAEQRVEIPALQTTEPEKTGGAATEEVAYADALQASTRKSFIAFLAKYPNGPRSDDARARLAACVQIGKHEVFKERISKNLKIGAAYIEFDGSYEDFAIATAKATAAPACAESGYALGRGKCVADKASHTEASCAGTAEGEPCTSYFSNVGMGTKGGKLFYNRLNCSIECFDLESRTEPKDTCL